MNNLNYFIGMYYYQKKKKKMIFMDNFFLDGFRNRLENKICRRFFLKYCL
jgi:hypothetical protein